MSKRRRRKSQNSGKAILILMAVTAIALIAVFAWNKVGPAIDPHAGQVQVYDGFDWVWMTPYSNVPVNDLAEKDFAMLDSIPTYSGIKYSVSRGIDVSEHQQTIDWRSVAASGIDYAYLRAGRRGYTEGGLFDDSRFVENARGCAEAGIPIGVYFFSQAITVGEAIEEANYVVNLIRGNGVTTNLPVVFDWEKIPDEPARTDGLGMDALTDCAIAFCETVKSYGYEACVYFNRNVGYYGFDLSRLTEYTWWFSLPEFAYPSFYYAVDMWQYSFTAVIPGISTPVDVNLWFKPILEQN